jgi:ABC-type multidrug transport system ATPase subunit
VLEHLYFYARLKGVPIPLEREAVQAALDLVDLFPHREKLVKHLSGGQKRRVSIAIALVADPKVVFLDEPTTGLDPEVRRTVWDTIARARSNRAILLVS